MTAQQREGAGLCERCGDPIEPGKPHPWVDHLSAAAYRQMLMEDAAEYARQEAAEAQQREGAG